MVTYPRSDHAQSCLTLAFDSECSHSVPPALTSNAHTQQKRQYAKLTAANTGHNGWPPKATATVPISSGHKSANGWHAKPTVSQHWADSYRLCTTEPCHLFTNPIPPHPNHVKTAMTSVTTGTSS